MKISISIPDPVFEAADDLAERLGVSRSALYPQAISQFLEGHPPDAVTARLNSVYPAQPSELDPVLAGMQLSALRDADG